MISALARCAAGLLFVCAQSVYAQGMFNPGFTNPGDQPHVTDFSLVNGGSTDNSLSLTQVGGGSNKQVRLSGDGNTFVSSFDNKIKMYRRNSDDSWTEQSVGAFYTDGAYQSQQYESDLDISHDGNTAVNSVQMLSAVCVHDRTGSTWGGECLTPTGGFHGTRADKQCGMGVSISGDGNTVIVGCNKDQSAHTWVRADRSSPWIEDAASIIVTHNRDKYTRQKLNYDGTTLVMGDVEATLVFARTGSAWTPQLDSNGDSRFMDGNVNWREYGGSNDISDDGNIIVRGAYRKNGNVGMVYVWTRSGDVWTLFDTIAPPDDRTQTSPLFFGDDLEISGDGLTLVVGALYEDSNMGAVWIYQKESDGFHLAYDKIMNPGSADSFSRTVTTNIDGKLLLVADGAGQVFAYTQHTYSLAPTTATLAPSESPNQATQTPTVRTTGPTPDYRDAPKGSGFGGTGHPTTPYPTQSPTDTPTSDAPTIKPTIAPTTPHPTSNPSAKPTAAPSTTPTPKPTQNPTSKFPTEAPTEAKTYVTEKYHLHPTEHPDVVTYKYLYVDGIDASKVKIGQRSDDTNTVELLKGAGITATVEADFESNREQFKAFKVTVTAGAGTVKGHGLVFPLKRAGNKPDAPGVCLIKPHESACLNIPIMSSATMRHTAYCRGSIANNATGTPAAGQIIINLPKIMELRRHVGHEHARAASRILPKTTEAEAPVWSSSSENFYQRGLVQWADECRAAGGRVETFSSPLRWNSHCHWQTDPAKLNVQWLDTAKDVTTVAPTPRPTSNPTNRGSAPRGGGVSNTVNGTTLLPDGTTTSVSGKAQITGGNSDAMGGRG